MEPSLLSQSVWLDLPLATRAKLASLFEFPEKGSVQTMYGPNGPVVLSDGYSYEHLKLITLEKMNAMLGTTSNNFYATFKTLLLHLDDVIGGESVVIEEEVIIVEATPEEFQEVFEGVVGSIGDGKPPFCESCDSKGVRHKKVCPKYA